MGKRPPRKRRTKPEAVKNYGFAVFDDDFDPVKEDAKRAAQAAALAAYKADLRRQKEEYEKSRAGMPRGSMDYFFKDDDESAAK